MVSVRFVSLFCFVGNFKSVLFACHATALDAIWKYTLLVSTVMCYVPACNWCGRPNMMLVTVSLCRTLEMMQNDVITLGIG